MEDVQRKQFNNLREAFFMKNLKNLFLVAALFVGTVAANTDPVAQVAPVVAVAPVVQAVAPAVVEAVAPVVESTGLVSTVTGAISGAALGATNFVLDNKVKLAAVVVLGAVAYYVATQYNNADADNN